MSSEYFYFLHFFYRQEFHKNRRKLGVFDVSFATGWDEPLFWAMQFKTANKINGFKPVSYGMAVVLIHGLPFLAGNWTNPLFRSLFSQSRPTKAPAVVKTN